MDYQVLVIGSRDDLSAGWERATKLSALLTEMGTKNYLVNKLGFVLDDLHLVAKYKVVTTPTVIIRLGDRVVFRQLGLPSARLLNEVIAAHRGQKASDWRIEP